MTRLGTSKCRNKYKNEPMAVNGITFDSKAEARRYSELMLLQKAGNIRGFGMQPSFQIGAGIRYLPDFIVCGADGSLWVEDVKGVETQVFKMKKKLFESAYPWLELRLIR